MNIEHLRRSLKAQWLQYYRENRDWLTRLGIWVNCEGQRRPSSSFILATLSILEPQLTQMLPLVVDLSSNPDRIVIALGLNFNPDEELVALEQAAAEEVKLLTPFNVALPRLVQPMETQPMEPQPITTRATEVQATEVRATEISSRKERSPLSPFVGEQSQQPAAPSDSQPPAPRSLESSDAPQSQSPPSPAKLPKSAPQPAVESKPLPPISRALERPKPPLPSFSEPAVKQRPPLDTAELAHGQQPDRGTTRKPKGDRPEPPARS